ncbi:hypothetical protein EIP91_011315 [Steccherinum ochraceum]|uniref:F-box domain-containing protein n=1 Tax=Steccherinum ochraceum TaxID=92696 RepID=A0A4R0RL12_9APHY|nr:hypothetical protein EIP91_011315 [Steccherinum ochraceum]
MSLTVRRRGNTRHEMPFAGQHLARELKDMILSQLDQNTLAACTLLGTQDGWRATAQAHLFRSITVHDSLTNIKRNFAAFRNDLSSVLLDCVPYIQELVIRGEGMNDSEITVPEVQFILQRLPALNALTLSQTWLKVPSVDRFPVPFAPGSFTPRSLSALRLQAMTLDLEVHPSGTHVTPESTLSTTSSFVGLLNMFSSVKTMELRSIGFTWHSRLSEGDTRLLNSAAQAEGAKISPLCSLEELSIDCSSRRIFGFLTTVLQHSSAVRELQRLNTVLRDNGDYLNCFLSAVGQSLRNARVVVSTSQETDERNAPNCPSLTSFHLSTTIRYNIPGTSLSHSWNRRSEGAAIYNSIMRAPLGTSELVVDIRAVNPEFRPRRVMTTYHSPLMSDLNLDWTNLDQQLMSRPRLHKLAFNFAGKAMKGESEDAAFARLEEEGEKMKSRLPLFRKEKTLLFSYEIEIDGDDNEQQ